MAAGPGAAHRAAAARVATTPPLPRSPAPPQFNNSHGALGDRARKLKTEGILIIRFESARLEGAGGAGAARGGATDAPATPPARLPLNQPPTFSCPLPPVPFNVWCAGCNHLIGKARCLGRAGPAARR